MPNKGKLEKLELEEKKRQLKLIDQAALGSIEAAAELAEGYLRGSFGEAPNKEKARKWASYAAKRSNQLAIDLLKEMNQ